MGESGGSQLCRSGWERGSIQERRGSRGQEWRAWEMPESCGRKVRLIFRYGE